MQMSNANIECVTFKIVFWITHEARVVVHARCDGTSHTTRGVSTPPKIMIAIKVTRANSAAAAITAFQSFF